MSIQAKRIQTLDVELEAKMGTLARIYSAFKEGGVNINASWAYEMGPGEAQGHFYAADLNKAKSVLTQMGLKPEIGNAVWVEGDDRLGGYAEVLGKVAKAGVNINASDALGLDGRFATVLFTENKDYSGLCKALNI